MTEKKFWQALKRLLPDVHWQRIETTTGCGIPDVNGCYKAGEFWLELKVLKGKHSLSFQSSLKPLQSAWLFKRWLAGGRCFIAACYEDEILVWNGCRGNELIHNTSLELVEPDLKLTKPWDKGLLLNFFAACTAQPS